MERLLEQSPQVRRGVTVYQPQQQAQPFVMRRPMYEQPQQQRQIYVPPAQTRAQIRTQREQFGGADAFAHSEQVYLNSPEAQKQRQDAAEAQAKANQPDVPWWKKALGYTIGNLAVPLGALNTPLRGIELGVSEFAQHTPLRIQQGLARAAQLASGDILGAAGGTRVPGLNVAPAPVELATQFITSTKAGGFIDPEQAKNAPGGSNLARVLNPTSPYGYGGLLDPNAGKWRNRFVGFAGDTLFNPLTYVEPVPAARVLSAGDEAAGLASNAAEDALRAAVREGAPAERIAALQAERDAAQQAFRESQVAQRIHGRVGRARIVAEAYARDPEAAAFFESEWVKGAQRGFNTMSPEARRALGIADPSLYLLGGKAVPYTGKYSELLSKAGGAFRGFRDAELAGGRLPLVQKLTAGPQEIQTPLRILSNCLAVKHADDAMAVTCIMLRVSYHDDSCSFFIQVS